MIPQFPKSLEWISREGIQLMLIVDNFDTFHDRYKSIVINMELLLSYCQKFDHKLMLLQR